MWIYSQALGTLYRRQTMADPPTAEGQGYAGSGTGLNNPSMQCMEDLGPLPRGQYNIGAPIEGPTSFALPLSPAPGTDMCSPPRTSFYIHGDRNSEPPIAPHAASHGCIVLGRPIREKIWNSGDRTLQVIDYGPQ